jgi:hypothetical protein
MNLKPSVVLLVIAVALSGCVGAPGSPAADASIEATGDAPSASKDPTGISNASQGIALDETGTNFRARVGGHVVPDVAQMSVWSNDTIGPGLHAMRDTIPGTDGCCITLFEANGAMGSVEAGIKKDVPMEITVTTTWENSAGNTADLYPVVMFPMYCDMTQYNQWYDPDGPVASTGKHTRTYTFAYVVRSDLPEQDLCGSGGYNVGVATMNNVITTGLAFTQETRFRYIPNTLTEFTPYAVNVPENVSSFTLKYVGSVKDPTAFLKVLDPEDQLVNYLYDRTNIFAKFPSTGIEISTPSPGEYVVFLEDMDGPRFGLLAIESESPNLTVRQLPAVFDEQRYQVDSAAPVDVKLPATGLLDVFFWWTEMPGSTAPAAAAIQTEFFLASSKGDYRHVTVNAITACDPGGMITCGPAYLGGFGEIKPDAFVNKGPYKVRSVGTTKANVEVFASSFSYVR